MVMFMTILRCTIMVMTRMTTTGHIQAVMKTATIRTVRGIIIMGIRHSEMMSSSTTTITTCGDNKQDHFSIFFVSVGFFCNAQKKAIPYPIYAFVDSAAVGGPVFSFWLISILHGFFFLFYTCGE